MHDIDTSHNEFGMEPEAYEAPPSNGDMPHSPPPPHEPKRQTPLSEEEETELAAELMEIGNEEELEYFLDSLVSIGAKLLPGLLKGAGGLFGGKGGGRGAGMPASRGSALGGALKGIAKTALPFVGSALGSVVPGVGTAIGGTLGSALGGLFEMELEGLDPEDQDFQKARRFVRLTTTAAQKAAAIPPHVAPHIAAQAAIKGAVQSLAPRAVARHAEGVAGEVEAASGQAGRWVRRGNKIVLYGV